MLIPHTPDVLVLPIVTYWDGTPCANTRLHGVVTLGAEDEGSVSLLHYRIRNARVSPATPPRTRVANLWSTMWWNVSSRGRRAILKSNSAPEGTFSCLDFAAPRVRRNAYEAFVPRMTFEPCLEGKPAWRCSILIPWSMVPVHVQGVNAYIISRQSLPVLSSPPWSHAGFPPAGALSLCAS